MQRILYIDDSEVELNRAQTVLSGAGYHVTTRQDFSDVDDALKAADMVIIDFHMPGINGGEALQLLKGRLPADAEPPAFYLYTSDRDVGTTYKALGFDGRIILKGNGDALLRQVDAAQRMLKLRKMRPEG